MRNGEDGIDDVENPTGEVHIGDCDDRCGQQPGCDGNVVADQLGTNYLSTSHVGIRGVREQSWEELGCACESRCGIGAVQNVVGKEGADYI